MVILLLGVFSVYTYPKAFNSSAMTLDAQARNLMGHLQRAQLLAISTGNQVSFCTSSSHYLVQIGAQACPTLPAAQSSSRPIQVTLSNNVTLSASSPLVFDSLGKPNTSTSLQLNASPAGSRTISVNVAAVTGYASR